LEKIVVYYRFCDCQSARARASFATKERCLENFLSIFKSCPVIVIADNCSPESVQWLKSLDLPVFETHLGNSGSFRYAVDLALKGLESSFSYLYLVEDDYLHRPGALEALSEGLRASDYVTLYDHPDKYLPLYDFGEVTKVFTTKSSHWKETVSTCMTFGTNSLVLAEDAKLWDRYLTGVCPQDHQAFCELRTKGRRLISPIPGFATHTAEGFLAPFVDWNSLLTLPCQEAAGSSARETPRVIFGASDKEPIPSRVEVPSPTPQETNAPPRSISIVTPWLGHPELIADYERAVVGAEVITVDNGNEPLAAKALQAMTERLGGTYLRNETNAGFAAANNQGLLRATGEIVVFLNSDISAPSGWLREVDRDVGPEGLFGPSLAHQVAYGIAWPYLGGWCVAGTRKTWDRLGGWDAEAYPGPYWEDTDLSLRALEAGFGITLTNWPVQHKGGVTIGSPVHYGDSFEHNRSVFVARAKAFLPRTGLKSTEAKRRFTEALSTPSDIQVHLDLLFGFARGNVLELGVRTGTSTTALLAGVEAHGGHVWSVDVVPACEKVFAGHPQWTFLVGDSRNPKIGSVPEKLDLLFLDTEHTYAQVSAELELWAPRVCKGGMILIHDTETFPPVKKALADFCTRHGWEPKFRTNGNGLGVVRVPLDRKPT
jgi:predicted O-methyltransferase YrrM